MPDVQTFIITILLIVIVVLIALIRTQARKQYLAWREKDFESLRSEQMVVARKEAKTELESWKMESEAWIRQDAISRSHAVNLGKITEHLMPYMSVFPYNPKDVRFVGSPVDLIVFDGIDDGALRDIIFLEVKTGSSSLNARQRQIRDAILAGRVLWRELRI
jgi:predicted Holliday junction resolvase-like endonuclease